MKRIIPIFQLLIFGLSVYGQGNEASKKIIGQLARFETSYPIEKAYLQFDKPYYAAGDTIYFKGYITAGERHKLSNISGVLHIDLINTKNKIDQSIKLQLDSGLAWGDFALPDSLPAGNYRVRAYTQWMRNFNETGFFEKAITIGSSTPQKIPESGSKQAISNGKPDVQFFPEGGSMVAGIISKVAFKAIGGNGLGINVQGIVVDNDNNQVAAFSSMHLGMGYFYLKPKEGKTYKAKLTYANGTQNTTDLAKIEAQGIVLSVDNDAIPTAAVKITANNTYYIENRGKSYSLIIYSGGIATTVPCKLDSPVITLDILKRRLHTGVTTVTLFSPAGEPLAERLLFVQNYEQLSLSTSSDKAVYVKRERVNIKLNAMNRAGAAAEGHFSIAVTDESKMPVDENAENTIISNLLLTSDLKGYVEQPNYYFADTSTIARKSLDVLMLTQGYRRFEWKEVLDNGYPPVAYQPEKSLEINGMIKSLMGKPINNGMVTLLPSKGGPILTSVSDDKGVFHFRDLAFADTTHFMLSAVNARGKNSVNITCFKDEPEPDPGIRQQNVQNASDTAIASFIENEKLQRERIKYDRAKSILLKEVKIKAKKEPEYHSGSYVPDAAADQVIYGKDILYGGPLSVRLAGMIHRVHFVPAAGNSMVPVLNIGGPLHVLIDGAPGNLDDVSTDGVVAIEVLLPPNSYVYGREGINGMLVITTKPRSTDPKNMPSFGVLPITPKGFYKTREFYSPKYNAAITEGKQADLRSTIYWQPEIKTDANGHASFDFYNADGTGKYKVVVEGIDRDGNIGRQTYTYRVE